MPKQKSALVAEREKISRATVEFVQALLDDPRNAAALGDLKAREERARSIFEETLRLFYRSILGKTTRGILDDLVWRDGPAAAILAKTKEINIPGEDLGPLHESLLVFEAGFAIAPMSRFRRNNLEIVVPRGSVEPRRAKWIEDIEPGAFFLRRGIGRKGTGSYYTPGPIVAYLVRNTLSPLVAARSPRENPDPMAIASLRVLDPAMGAGVFLVEARRFLAEKLHEACASVAESESNELRRTVLSLPDEDTFFLLEHPRDPRSLEICGRIISSSCLFGVDRDALAVELCRLSLSGDEKHLVKGDSLAGPTIESLRLLPSSRAPVPESTFSRLLSRLSDALSRAAPLAPFLTLAAAWTGAVKLGDPRGDEEYTLLLETIAHAEPIEPHVVARQKLLRMIEAGKDAIFYDLVFPGVIFPDHDPKNRRGFDAILGNPPWDVVRRSDDEFFASYDLDLLEPATKAEKKSRFDDLLAKDGIGPRYEAYSKALAAKDRLADALFTVHKARLGKHIAGRGVYDDSMLFAERAVRLAKPGGRIGFVLPSAFHGSEGCAGLRRLYLDETRLERLFSFENKKKIFPIDARFKFALVVAEKSSTGTETFDCGFYLQDLDGLDRPDGPDGALRYSRQLVESLGGPHIGLLELRSREDLDVARRCHENALSFGEARRRCRVAIGQELNMTYDAHRFTKAREILLEGEDPRDPRVAAELREKGYLPLHEGKTFHQYDDRWDERPRYVVALAKLEGKSAISRAARYYRLSFRDIARSTDERTSLFFVAPPGVLFGNTAPAEREPFARPNALALLLCACANSFLFDWHVRRRAATHLNLFLLDGCPLPASMLDPPRATFAAHAALRLAANHEGYAELVREQIGFALPNPSFPLLPSPASRANLRAAIDAVFAESFGLSRADYAHVLRSFSHKSSPHTPERCLAAWDELGELGIDAFTRKYDPFWDQQLVMTAPEPMLDWSGAANAQSTLSTPPPAPPPSSSPGQT